MSSPELCWLDPGCASARAAICSVQGREHFVLALCGLSGQLTGALITHSTGMEPRVPWQAGREGAAVPGSCWHILLQLQPPRYRAGHQQPLLCAFITLLQRITPDKCQQMTLSPVNEVRFFALKSLLSISSVGGMQGCLSIFFFPSNVAESTDVQVLWATSII